MISVWLQAVLQQRVLILMAALGVILAGVFSFQQLRIDAFPEISPTQVKIIIKAPGLPPEELEGIPTVCASLREALESLEADNDFLTAGDVFTKDQIQGYIDLKWEEVYAYEHTPHPVEYQLYYSC